MAPRFDLVAFDLYGTLLDVRGLAGALERHLGPDAAEILGKWRTAQLEETWELNKNAKYQPWDRVTANARSSSAPTAGTRKAQSATGARWPSSSEATRRRESNRTCARARCES